MHSWARWLRHSSDAKPPRALYAKAWRREASHAPHRVRRPRFLNAHRLRRWPTSCERRWDQRDRRFSAEPLHCSVFLLSFREHSMNRTSFLRRLAMFFSIVILGLMVSLPRPARAADFTDLWFDRDESGWGVNIVQSDTFLFVTFFIYGKGNSPTWYTAQLTANGQGAYTGGLYLTQGTYYA